LNLSRISSIGSATRAIARASTNSPMRWSAFW
jgi:hypothetical protein